MKLMTKEIAERLYRADRQVIETGQGPDEIIVKYFNPVGSGTWYITSGTPLDDNGEPTELDKAKDWHLFGFADIGDPENAELGYVLLSELQSIHLPFGLGIERDIYYSNHRLSEVMAEYRR